MAQDLVSRLQTFDNSLAEQEPGEYVGVDAANIYNAPKPEPTRAPASRS